MKTLVFKSSPKNNPIIFLLSLSNFTFSKMLVNNAATWLGPDVTPIATFHVTPVCDDGEETGAHKVILVFLLLADAWRTLEGWC